MILCIVMIWLAVKSFTVFDEFVANLPDDVGWEGCVAFFFGFICLMVIVGGGFLTFIGLAASIIIRFQ